MTEEAQRIAIAEACGWTYDADAEQMVFTQDGDICGLPWPSLDAMHEAEKTLTASQIYDYISCLVDDTGAGWTDAFEEVFIVAHATTAQRAEAFLRTIGEWKD